MTSCLLNPFSVIILTTLSPLLHSDRYHELMQLLLLMPPGTPKLWDFLNQGIYIVYV